MPEKKPEQRVPDESTFTPHGFTWGPAKIERISTIREGEKIRGRVLGIETEKARLELWITPKGEIRVIRNEVKA